MLKSFANGSLFGATWGPSGPAEVLALHGWRRSHEDFAPAFASGPVSVVALDLPGFGATPPPDSGWGSEEYARALLELIGEPGVMAERFTVVGHSFGGRVAIRLAGLAPDRVGRLVLTGVPLLDREGRRKKPATGFRLARKLHSFGLVGDRRMEELRQQHGSPDYRAATGTMRATFVKILAESYAAELANIAAPVDLLWGEGDTEVPLEVARRSEAMFPDAALVTLPGVGHLTPTEAPEALRQLVVGGRP